jgi:hypothetical protein
MSPSVYARSFGVRIRGACARNFLGSGFGTTQHSEKTCRRPPDPHTNLRSCVQISFAPTIFVRPQNLRVRTRRAAWHPSVFVCPHEGHHVRPGRTRRAHPHVRREIPCAEQAPALPLHSCTAAAVQDGSAGGAAERCSCTDFLGVGCSCTAVAVQDRPSTAACTFCTAGPCLCMGKIGSAGRRVGAPDVLVSALRHPVGMPSWPSLFGVPEPPQRVSPKSRQFLMGRGSKTFADLPVETPRRPERPQPVINRAAEPPRHARPASLRARSGVHSTPSTPTRPIRPNPSVAMGARQPRDEMSGRGASPGHGDQCCRAGRSSSSSPMPVDRRE